MCTITSNNINSHPSPLKQVPNNWTHTIHMAQILTPNQHGINRPMSTLFQIYIISYSPMWICHWTHIHPQWLPTTTLNMIFNITYYWESLTITCPCYLHFINTFIFTWQKFPPNTNSSRPSLHLRKQRLWHFCMTCDILTNTIIMVSIRQ